MKTINTYIQEKLVVNNTIQDHINYNYHPKTREALIDCIIKKINKKGLGTKDNPLDLNDIDTSEITDMRSLFKHEKSYFDISKWDVSKVEDMSNMFYNSSFDGNISKWDVSNVKNMYSMFKSSKFTGKNGNISNWDVRNVKNMYGMFYNCPLENNPPKWYKS